MSSDLFSRIRVVLSCTFHPGNIGSAARAIKTMGLSRLVLVSPVRFPDREANALASNAVDVLENAVVCSSLDEALAGTALQIAFTARSRALSHASLPVREAVVDAVSVAASQEVALVFGNETVGLSNEDVIRCNRVAFIPTDAESSSLNLAAAVQIAAYELRLAALGSPGAQESASELAPHEEMERFFAHLEKSIYASSFLQPDNPRRMMERLRRQFGRSGLEKEEVNIWRGMLSAWDEKSKKGNS